MKPIIGIITRPDHLESGNKVDVIYSYIRKAVVENGGIPFVLAPPTTYIYEEEFNDLEKEWNDLKYLLSLCDGFIFQGGDSFYDYDLKIVNYAYKNNIPSLGICLGMQLMSYSRNGIISKLDEKFSHYSKEPYVHSVTLKEDSLLFQIIKEKEIMVNSRHHEYVAKTDLNVVGSSEDSIIEAVGDSKKKFFIGVQWHPEDMIAYDKVMKKLWSYFILVCKECSDESKRIDFKKPRDNFK